MNDEPYTLKDLSPEEAKKVTEELQAVLAKYDCDMGVTSTINIMKRVPVPTNSEPILSPIQPNNPNGEPNTNNDTTPPTSA